MKCSELLERKELLRPDEVAEILRVSRSQVYAMVNRGVLESASRRIGPVRIHSAGVKRLLLEQAFENA